MLATVHRINTEDLDASTFPSLMIAITALDCTCARPFRSSENDNLEICPKNGGKSDVGDTGKSSPLGDMFEQPFPAFTLVNGVKVRKRFVEKEQFWFVDEGTRQHHFLPLSFGQIFAHRVSLFPEDRTIPTSARPWRSCPQPRAGEQQIPEIQQESKTRAVIRIRAQYRCWP